MPATFTDADRIATIGLEGMWVHGPFKLQGEYMTASDIKRLANSDYTSTAGYIQGLWNITGETWGYKGGVPTTPLPNEPGSGMWQLRPALRHHRPQRRRRSRAAR